MTGSDLPRLRPRDREAHKGNFGRLLVVAGSPGMTGAAVLACRGALRAGAGLVTLGISASLMGWVASSLGSAMSVGLPEDSTGCLRAEAAGVALEFARNCDVAAIGPGLRRAEGTATAVRSLLEGLQIPVVLDADGINALEGRVEVLGRRPAPTVLTPHAGELARLIPGVGAARLLEDESHALAFAARCRVILVLKGHRTLVTDGTRTWRNSTGNPGLATGGSGDVLTGVVAALIGQGMDPWDAARCGVFLHGRAADLAAARVGEVSLVPEDVVESLSTAIREWSP